MKEHFDCTRELDQSNFVACYRVGRRIPIPAEVNEAFARLRALMTGNRDATMLREWGGGVIIQHPCSREENPEVTEQMLADATADAAERFPTHEPCANWPNSQHGITGISVRMRPKTKDSAQT